MVQPHQIQTLLQQVLAFSDFRDGSPVLEVHAHGEEVVAGVLFLHDDRSTLHANPLHVLVLLF